jgi:shikimate kinase
MKSSQKNIILIGYKASGKSTLGKKLASYLNYQFIDTDILFYETYGIYPHIYYAQHGESRFRDLEKNMLLNLNSLSSTVIATGGGVVEDISSIQHLKTLGKLVYLRVNFNVVKRRLTSLGRIPDFVEIRHFKLRDKKYLGVCDRKISLYPKENIDDSFAKLVDKLGDLYGE